MDELGQQLKPIAVPLLIVAFLGFGTYLLIAAIIDKLNSINTDVGKAIIAGTATVIISVLSLVVGKIWEQKIKDKQDIRQKKIPVYEEQVAAIFSLLFAEKCGEDKPTDQQIIKAFSGFTQKLIIWGGPTVIKAWSDFRLGADPTNTAQFFGKWQTFLMALRQDIGNSNSNLEGGDLMRLFINDYGTEVQTLDAESKFPH